MTESLAETLALLALFLSLGAAVLRPRGLPEAALSVPLAVLLVLVGVVSVDAMRTRLRELAPTVAFLALILLFGQLCAQAGVFDYLGARAARASRGNRDRLLALVVILAAAVTVTLTLDATVVLLTPVVLRTVHRLRIAARPHVYGCVEIANAGSLLLPVSNLTNLLAFSATGLTFAHFTALMTLPWVVVCGLQWLALRLFFRTDLVGTLGRVDRAPEPPRYALVVLGMTVAGFVATSSVHVRPAWAALGGCVLLGIPLLRRRVATPRRMLAGLSLGFCLFVLALGVIVEGVTQHGLGTALAHLVPVGGSLPALLGVAALAAVTANVLNNLPATLLLVPLTIASPLAVLAVLVGVNVGPNATYPGSLATLLWRRSLPPRHRPRAVQFHTLGLLATPPILVAATVCLWLAGRAIGT
jgi:arsenical pump membrane protein